MANQASKTELINDLIRRARKEQDDIDAIRAALRKGEESGLSDKTAEEVRQSVLSRLRKNGEL